MGGEYKDFTDPILIPGRRGVCRRFLHPWNGVFESKFRLPDEQATRTDGRFSRDEWI